MRQLNGMDWLGAIIQRIYSRLGIYCFKLFFFVDIFVKSPTHVHKIKLKSQINWAQQHIIKHILCIYKNKPWYARLC